VYFRVGTATKYTSLTPRAVWYDMVICTGLEHDIRDCIMLLPTGYSMCSTDDDAGVICSLPFTPSRGA